VSAPVKVMLVCGTRPEAIKMAPVVLRMRATPGIDARLCSTGQHREMLDQVLALFGLVPDMDLAIMQAGQDLVDVSVAVTAGLRDVFADWMPDHVLVHGDTNTAFAAALAAYYHRIPVAHVEAGLRTGNLLSPWPEEGNRRLVGAIAARHYAPTAESRDNLLAENIDPARIRVTGNTVIDALLSITARLEADETLRAEAARGLEFLDPRKRLVLVTGHRRENFGEGFERICRAMVRIADRPDVQLVYPVHLNPAVRDTVARELGDIDNVHLTEPLAYLPFVHAMSRSHFIITDSGGIQEEAPALGKPVLVMRETTERPEAVAAGTVRLVGTDVERIVAESCRLLDDDEHHRTMSRALNPYGTGDACRQIVEDVLGGGIGYGGEADAGGQGGPFATTPRSESDREVAPCRRDGDREPHDHVHQRADAEDQEGGVAHFRDQHDLDEEDDEDE